MHLKSLHAILYGKGTDINWSVKSEVLHYLHLSLHLSKMNTKFHLEGQSKKCNCKERTRLDILETTVRKRQQHWFVGHLCTMHGRLQKSKRSIPLGYWWVRFTIFRGRLLHFLRCSVAWPKY